MKTPVIDQSALRLRWSPPNLPAPLRTSLSSPRKAWGLVRGQEVLKTMSLVEMCSEILPPAAALERGLVGVGHQGWGQVVQVSRGRDHRDQDVRGKVRKAHRGRDHRVETRRAAVMSRLIRSASSVAA